MKIDFTGKRVLVAGVADDVGFGFAIAKQFAEAGAKVCIAGWPPALGIFETLLRRGKLDESRKMSDGSMLEFERVYPLDAVYDTLEQVPQSIRENKRYAERGDFSIQGLLDRMLADFGANPVDVVVHSLANGPEVAKPLLDTTREGYLAALSASAYSMVSMVRRFAPHMKPGGAFMSLTYMASERVIPRYGGGMSSAKAALEADTRYLAFEAGRRYGVRINTISAGPYASRAANVTGAIATIVNFYEQNSPQPARLTPEDVANSTVFLCSPLARAITGTTMYVDNGFHSMGKALGEGDLDWVMKAGDVPREG
ncbi:MAG TPA: enoyl-[acyl-carrier-protein] reductase [Polyangiaceae bacterium]|nr:enoyl-[acyl-carrier-protein] reductase [Polyangiaceae bacterium]